MRRNYAGRRLQPPDQSARNHQADRDQLSSSHDPAENFTASGIVADEFQKIPGNAIENEISGQHLSVKFLALEDPHQNEKVRQLNRRLEELGGLERYSEGGVGIQIGDGIGESHSPEVSGRLAIAATCGEASYAPDGMAQFKSGSKTVPGRQRRHVVLTDIPDCRNRRADQPSRKNAAR